MVHDSNGLSQIEHLKGFRRAWQVYNIIQGSDRGPTQEEWGSMNINADLLDELEVTGMLKEALRTYYDCPTCHSQGEHGFL